jgi:hypothetical protein
VAAAHCRAHAQFGWTALSYSAHNGYPDCVLVLLEAGADPNSKDEVRVSVAVLAVGRVLVGTIVEW